VCLPDYQGVGIGNALFSFVASMWSGLGFRAFSNTGHPAEIAHRNRSPIWEMTRAPSQTAKGSHTIDRQRASNRLTASFEYIGEPLEMTRAKSVLETWADVHD